MTLLSIPGVSAVDTVTLPEGANGYSTITPSVGSRIIYVSDSLGDDANNTDGYETYTGSIDSSYSTPLATIAKGITYLRDDNPDWLVLKKGDTWYESLGQWLLSGESAVDRMVITSYGAGTTRPLLKTSGTAFSTSGGGGGPTHNNYLIIYGIEFYSYTRDPANNPGEYVEASGGPGISMLRGCDYLLIEDCKFTYYSLGLSIDDFDGYGISEVSIRKNVIAYQYQQSASGHSQGMYMNKCNNVIIEENYFDHNGWHDTVTDGHRTGFNHGIYLQSENTLNNIDVNNNIIMRSSSHGVQHRSGGELKGNLVVENAIGLLMGANATYHPTPVVIGIVDDNIILNSDDIDGSNPRGWGIDAEQTISPTTIHDNILAHVYGTNVSGIDVAAGATADQSGNIIEDWGGADTGSPEDYVDSTVEIEDYSTSVGDAGTRADFFAQVALQSKDSYNTDYDVANIKQYFLDNFALV